MQNKIDTFLVKKLIVALACSSFLFASQNIEISQQQQDNLGIRTQEITPINSISFGPYNATVKIDKKDIISIGMNVGSVVKNIHVKKFDLVKKGDKLLTLQSSELLNLQREYIESLIDGKNIDENYERNIGLNKEGIISHKKLLISKKEKQRSDLRITLSKNHLISNGISQNILKRIENTYMPVTELTLYSPKDGSVNEIDVNIGEVVDSQKSMISIYADGDRYLELSVPVKTVDNISLNDKVKFSNYSAKVTTIGRIVNSSSQSVQVRAIIDNSKNIMINRIYPASIYKEIKNAIKVKKSAVVFQEDNSYIFKKTNTGFDVIEVNIIQEGPVCYIVDAKLKSDESVAVSSTSALLSAMDSEDE